MSVLRPISVLMLLLSLSFTGFAHNSALTKANKLFNELAYSKAIPYYQKAYEKEELPHILIKLADCYRLTSQFVKAEDTYKNVLDLKERQDIHLLYYAEALMSNQKYAEAKVWLEMYIDLAPDHKMALAMIKTCENIQELRFDPGNYELKLLPINSEASEFSPSFYKDGIVFVTETEELGIRRTNTMTGKGFYDLTYASTNKDGEWSDPKPLRGKTKSIFHEGPVSYSQKGDMMYFTQTNKDKSSDGLRRMGIYQAKLKGKSWTQVSSLPFQNLDYTYAHPAVSADNKSLFLMSDKPGGYGGTDIYVSYWTNDGWTDLKNLGSTVNTSGNESFPFMHQDGTLFFASTGHGGLGGLDIFASRMENGEWSTPANLGVPINSSKDDLGLILDSDYKSGYFSSNRPGGMGSDDIYRVDVLKRESLPSIQKTVVVAGKVSDRKHRATEDVMINLLNEAQEVIATTKTAKDGSFRFERLPADGHYMVNMVGNEIGLNAQILLMDMDGNIIRKTTQDKHGVFRFEKLPAFHNGISLIDVNDPGLMTGEGTVVVFGKIVSKNDPLNALPGIKVNLVDANGNVIKTVTTGPDGSFDFKNLPADMNFMVQMDAGVNPDLYFELMVMDGAGIVLKTANSTDERGFFKFEKLPAHQDVLTLLNVDEPGLSFEEGTHGILGKIVNENNQNMPAEGITVLLLDEAKNVIGSTKTDASGGFKFEKLPQDKRYLVRIDGQDAGLMIEMLLADEYGKAIQFSKQKASDGYFRFEKLPYNRDVLAMLDGVDPSMVFELGRAYQLGDILFGYGLADIPIESQPLLNKIVEILKADPGIKIEVASYTDSKGSSAANVILSRRRSQTVAWYMKVRGIKESRLITKWYGEEKPIAPNTKPDGSDNPDGRKKNRRTTFKFI